MKMQQLIRFVAVLGFAATGTSFALPPDYALLGGTDETYEFCGSGQNTPAHVTMDVDGDRVPDLVVTGNCDDATIDQTHWLVYAGTGSGFASTPSTFSLPPDYQTLGGTAETYEYCGSGQNTPAHVTLDVDGDRIPDLLVTEACNDATIDQTHWLLYRGTGSGFDATPTSYALPPGYTELGGVAETYEYCGSGQDTPAHTMLDADGDGTLDLLVTTSCDDATADETHWLLYRGACAPE